MLLQLYSRLLSIRIVLLGLLAPWTVTWVFKSFLYVLAFLKDIGLNCTILQPQLCLSSPVLNILCLFFLQLCLLHITLLLSFSIFFPKSWFKWLNITNISLDAGIHTLTWGGSHVLEQGALSSTSSIFLARSYFKDFKTPSNISEKPL